jgi:hypothetical protein
MTSSVQNPEDVVNLALGKLGALKVNDLDDLTNTSAVEANTSWALAFLSVAREYNWNCLSKTAQLVQIPQTPLTNADGTSVIPSYTPWAPSTSYAAGVYVSYGGQLYQALIAATSTASFTNDLNSGFWFQTDIFNSNPFGLSGENYASGWSYQYSLPSDFVLLSTLNDNNASQISEEWEIMGRSLFTDQSTAVIRYIGTTDDTTQLDPLFTECLVYMLASKMATSLRKDDLSSADKMMAHYQRALTNARTKDAGERTARRFNPVTNSRFVSSRWYSTNA